MTAAPRLGLWTLVGLVTLMGCKEASPVSVSVEAAGCLGTSTGAVDGCRARIDGLVSEGAGTACLVLTAGGSIHRLPYRWISDGETSALEATGGVQIPFSAGMRVSGALFLFADASGCSPELTAETDCEAKPGCAARLSQPVLTLGDSGGQLDFKQDGVCQIQPGLALREGTPLDGEYCDGVDNDCDGRIDEGFHFEGVALGEPCSGGVGDCTYEDGVVACAIDGSAAICNGMPASTGAVEICNGVDDNCNGVIDEDAVQPCGVDRGQCAQGVQRCVDGALSEQCVDAETGEPVVLPQPETCDGTDQDCDGLIDEDFEYVSGAETIAVGAPCSEGQGVCRGDGVVECDGPGAARCTAQAGAPQAETCNGLDDDCDGVEDNLAFVECSGGVGACVAVGQMTCPEGGGVAVCSAEVPGGVREQCTRDGEAARDEDCDGETDEGLDPLGVACGDGEGACRREGTTVCDGSGTVSCSVQAGQPRPEICNGDDDDCDGTIDEGFVLETDPANCGACGASCAVPNAAVSCVAGGCVLNNCRGAFIDLDGDYDTGCECDPTQRDLPDPEFIDLNCDGVDGDGRPTRSIFASPTGNDATGTGSRDQPFRSVAAAVRLAGQLQPRRPVLLAEGDYDLSDGAAPDAGTHGIRIPSQVSIYGGYVPGEAWRRRSWSESPSPTRLHGSAVMLRYEDLDGPTALGNLVVEAADAETNRSSVAVVAINVGAHLTLQGVRLVSGRGGEGAAGADGAHGADGALQGADGEPNGAPDCSGCGGLPGTNPACGATTSGGRGGNGGVNAAPAATGDAGSGDSGGLGGPGGVGDPGEGGLGGNGADGAHGESREPGLVDGRIDDLGSLLWVPRGSTQGTAGQPGSGGGGGGGGVKGPGMSAGGGGGGGGAAGCAGAAGLGATGGGGSFALHVMGGLVHLREVRLQAGAGGTGGRGGSGGVGAPGARGGAGAASMGCPGCGVGGGGGRGGSGGCGGNAGGGSGGPSYAILRVKPAAGTLDDSVAVFENPQGNPEFPQDAVAIQSLTAGGAGRGGAGGDAAARDESAVRGVVCGDAAPAGFPGRTGLIGCCRNGPGANQCGLDLSECGE